MKTIKYILAIIIFFTLVFIGTGLFIKEISYKNDISINKKTTEVFNLFDDPKNFNKWIPEIKKRETIKSTNNIKIGNSYKIIVDNKGQHIQMIEKIKAYIKNKKITIQYSSNDMIRIDDFNFVNNGEKTTIIQKSTIRAKKFILACIFPWFNTKFKKISKNYLIRFKKFAENL